MKTLSIKSKTDFKNLQLNKFPVQILGSKRLMKLDLSHNSIKVIPKEIGDLILLDRINLSNNRIREVYSKLFQLPKLKILNLNNNRLINLPKQVNQLANLREFHLSNNQLEELPTEFGELKELISLNISYNKFKVFPESIFQLKKLRTLWIGGNYFKEIPFTRIYNDLPELQRIYTFSNINYVDNPLIDPLYLSFCSKKENVINKLQNEIVLFDTSLKNELENLLLHHKINIFFSKIFKIKIPKESKTYSELILLHARYKQSESDFRKETITREIKNSIDAKLLEDLLFITNNLKIG